MRSAYTLKTILLATAFAVGLSTLGFAATIQIITQNAMPAWQEAEHLISTSPGDGETVTQPVESVSLNFSKQVRVDQTVVRVYNDYGTNMVKGGLTINGLVISATLSPLPPGKYRVQWRSSCACNDASIDGMYHFTVKPAPSVTTFPPVPTVP